VIAECVEAIPDRGDDDAAALGLTSAGFSVYVAGASKEIRRAERVIELLRESGIRISFDWCAHMRGLESSKVFSADVAAASARSDLDGVREASVLLLLEPGWAPRDRVNGTPQFVRVQSTGVWTELGAALAWGVPVVLARPLEPDSAPDTPHHWQNNVFAALVSLVAADDDAAIRAVVRLALTGAL